MTDFPAIIYHTADLNIECRRSRALFTAVLLNEIEFAVRGDIIARRYLTKPSRDLRETLVCAGLNSEYWERKCVPFLLRAFEEIDPKTLNKNANALKFFTQAMGTSKTSRGYTHSKSRLYPAA